MDELRFDGRAAIVTGAGRGVGRCHALLLAERGAQVVVADLGGSVGGGGSSGSPAQEVVDEIRAAGGEAVACHGSVAEEAGAAAIVAAAVDAFGRVDIVVNNAGIAAPDWFEDLTAADFERMAAVHYFGTVLVTRAAWPHLVESGAGRVVNTWSEAVFGFVPKSTPYAGGKGGVVGFTKALALEGPRHGIKVNAVAPRAQTRLSGPEIMAKTYDVPVEMFEDGSSLAVFAPELVSPAVAYLAHESCAVNGELFVSGGGQVLRVALVANDGLRSDALTPEAVAEHLDQIMDISEGVAIEVGTMAGEEISAAREEAGVD